MATKERKITIKPFLNTQLGPSGSITDDNGTVNLYPLYYKVTYNRKNTQLKSLYALQGFQTLEQINKNITDFEIRILEKIVAYQVRENQEQYELTGLKRKFEACSLAIDNVVDTNLRRKLESVVMSLPSPYKLAVAFDNYSIENNILNIHTVCERLFPDLKTHLTEKYLLGLKSYREISKTAGHPTFHYHFPTLIDWINEVFRKEFKADLLKVYKEEQTEQLLSAIDEIITDRLKNIL